MKLDGKIALVTGGTSGIGLETAQKLAQAGAYTIAVGREGSCLRSTAIALEGSGEALDCDVADPHDISQLMRDVRNRHGRLDILVINAGVSNAPAIDQLTVQNYDSLMDINCRGSIFTFVEALPLLAGSASVVFTGSVAGRKGQPGDPLYAASKGFIRAFVRSAGTDRTLLARGLRVNVVSPGPTETPMTEKATSNESVKAWVEGIIPMGRWGRAEEVADAILFLASNESSYITGTEITVDGGMSHA